MWLGRPTAYHEIIQHSDNFIVILRALPSNMVLGACLV